MKLASLFSRRSRRVPYPVDIPAVERWAQTHFPGKKRATAAGTLTILITQTGVPVHEITPASSFLKDIGWREEFDTVELVMAVEERFGVPIHDKDPECIRTFGDLVDYIHEQLKTTKA